MLPFLLLAVIIGLISAIPSYIRNNRLKNAGILDTDTMDGIEFEDWLKHRFKEMGYRVQTTPRTGDGGADLILTGRNGERIAVQAKKSAKQNIGVKAIDEVLRGIRVHDCDRAMVVTNQYYTDQAKRDAKKCNIELWNRDDLLERIEIFKKAKQQLANKKTG
ncbi:MAG: hypothetical protein JL56_05775 [Desulfotomaculum sp. BICA1-6]|nr:MAG: hypothetical protein JL56_05775 [Desulfotomaculum sp. BICA1-6]